MPRDQVGTVGTGLCANANAKERVKEKDTAKSKQPKCWPFEVEILHVGQTVKTVGLWDLGHA